MSNAAVRFLQVALGAVALVALAARGDQIEMQNGDRYVGKVLSLSTDTLLLQSEVLGVIKLPRNQVATINLGASPTNSPARIPTVSVAPAPSLPRPAASPTIPATNSNDISIALRQLGADTNLIKQVQQQFLSGAGPEANDKFNDLMNGLISGRLNVNDIRAEAKSAAAQLHALKKDVGDEAGFAVDGYLTILESFLRETASYDAPTTNSPPAPRKTKSPGNQEE